MSSREVAAVLLWPALMMMLRLSTAQQDSPLYQVARLAAESGNSSRCHRQLAAVRHGVDDRRLWSLNLLDASGAPAAGFLWGNGYWLGSYSQCRSAGRREPPLQLAGNRTAPLPHSAPPFPVHYLAATATHGSPLQLRVGLPGEDLVTIGLCVPLACEPVEVADLLEEVFLSRSLQFQTLLGLDLQLQEVRSLQDDSTWLLEISFIIVACVVLLAMVLVAAGTLYDTIVWQPRTKAGEDHPRSSKEQQHIAIHVISSTVKGPQIKSEQPPSKEPTKQMHDDTHTQGCVGRFLLCFSAYSNTGIILDTNLGTDSIGAIHGMRFMGMIWIVMVHTIFYLGDYADNKPQAFFMSEGFMVQIISNSVLSVDTFFFLSGFLVAYLYYKGKSGQKKVVEATDFKAKLNEFLKMVARRFMRLTPAYMAVLGLTTISMAYYSRVSPYHMTERADIVCPQYWWRNLLYINNLFSREEMCMSWSWYLSNDMQFFILGAFLLVLSSTHFVLSVVVLVTVLVTSSLATGALSYNYGYVPTLDEQLSMLNVLYDPPWTRVGPYLVGMATGYVVVRLDGRLPLSKCVLLLCWVAGSSLNLATLFGLYNRNLSPATAAAYVALSRPVWGLGLAWLVVACCTHNAGIINKLLSFPAWIPFSRLTYCAYLLNPLIMNSVYLSSERPLHVDFLPLSSYFFGHLMSSYFCAYAVSLTFETPVVLLMRHFVERPRRRHASR